MTITAVLFLVFTQISAPHIVLYPAGSRGTLRMRGCKTQAPPIVAPELVIRGILRYTAAAAWMKRPPEYFGNLKWDLYHVAY